MTFRAGIAAVVATLACAGCGGPDESTAKSLIEASFKTARAARCGSSLPTRAPNGAWSFIDGHTGRACGDDLEKAGLIKRGACLDAPADPGGSCSSRAFEPSGGAVLDDKGLSFACGELALVEIETIDKEPGGTVMVTFVRDFKDAPVAAQLEHCNNGFLQKPEAGRAERWRKLARKPDGSWEIETKDGVEDNYAMF